MDPAKDGTADLGIERFQDRLDGLFLDILPEALDVGRSGRKALIVWAWEGAALAKCRHPNHAIPAS